MSLSDRIEIRLEPGMRQQLQQEAERSERSIGAVIRIALREHLDKKKVKVRT